MKTSTIGIVSVAVLMVVAGVGFGIAQAAGTHTDRPVLSFEDQEASDVSQARGPVETGAIPGAAVEESWMKDYGSD